MSLDLDQFRTDIRNVIAEDPVEIGYLGQTVDGVRGNFLDENRVLAAGLQGIYEFSVMSVKEDWSLAPVQDKVITVAGVEMRVLRVREDAPGVAYVLDLGAKFHE